MSAVLDPQHWSVHGGAAGAECTLKVGNENLCTETNVLTQRNYPCDNIIETYFGKYDLDEVGEVSVM